ncbi:MAG: DUF4918 family protein [Bacteroidetes bacterium]|nr:DUF4918 family protein [Bacteroidota bacterium]
MSQVTVSEHILSFFKSLGIDASLPRGVTVMNPYLDPETFTLCQAFFEKYYSDHKNRKLILGINPGRLGAGLTGISFTDPVRLERICGIKNHFVKKPELSSEFVFKVIEEFGGPEAFFGQFFISSLSPLGFIKGGKNVNYYDLPALEKKVTPFIVQTLTETMSWGIFDKEVLCLGEGKNYRFLERLNSKHGWFSSITPLPHPRFIMQYRRKKLDEYTTAYLKALE